MKPLSLLGNKGFGNSVVVNRRNKNTTKKGEKQNKSSFFPDLDLSIYPIENVIDTALDSLLYLKSEALPQFLAIYIREKEKGNKQVPEYFLRCQNLENAVNQMFFLIEIFQKYLPEIIQINRVEKIGKKEWGGLPLNYCIELQYALSSSEMSKKLKTKILKNGTEKG